jgi:hypothetical protein
MRWHAACNRPSMPTKPLRIAIIGSGLSGAVLAERLAGHHEVTIFERGSEEPTLPPPAAMPSHPFGLYPSFAYGLGGTTNFWHGGMVRLLNEEMGTDWSGSLKTSLPQYYAGVVRQLYGDAALRAWHKWESPECIDGLFPTMMLYARTPFRAATSGFLRMGSLLLDHCVEHITEHASGVSVISRVAGKETVERFDRVVIAAGALNSPLILRNSGLGGPTVGENFTDHPMGFVAKLRAVSPGPEFLRLRRKNGLFQNSVAMLKVRDTQTGLWSAFYLRACFGSRLTSDPYRRSFRFLAETRGAKKYLAALPHLRDPDFLWQALENHLHLVPPSSHAYVLVVNQQEAMGQGRARAEADGRLIVDWHISDAVEGAIRRNLERLAAHTGAELLLPDGSLRDRLWSAAHHSGTCRISPDTETGVVDEDLRVHGTKHIYVCDGSVLPSTGASNTGLTIAAFAHRLTELLCDNPKWRRVTSSGKHLLISGITGAVGKMVRAHLAGLKFDWSAADLRSLETGAISHAKSCVLLHLANAHRSVEENIRLQEQAAAFADREGIAEVIVPMSGSTIDVADASGPRSDAKNFGFACSQTDPYPRGKRAAERCWLEWQSAKPGRRLALVYVPTIIGPRSQWTRRIAKHAPDATLVVPRLERFLAVTESDLIELFSALTRHGLPAGVSRHFALSSSQSLAEAVLADRGGKLTEVRLPGFIWFLVGMSYRSDLLQKAISAARVLIDRVLRLTLGHAILPVSPRYLHLFRIQSDVADAIESVSRERDRRASRSARLGALTRRGRISV